MSFINKEIEECKINDCIYHPENIETKQTINTYLFSLNKYPYSDYKIDVVDFIFDNFNEHRDYRSCSVYIKVLINNIKTEKSEIQIFELWDPLNYYMNDAGEFEVYVDSGDFFEDNVENHIFIQDKDIYPDLIKSAKVKVKELLIKLNKIDKI